MESSFSNSETDPLLLLKERIIKTETLLEKYACLNRKYIDLENALSEAVENEKKAKKDASKYLEKYCKLVKKSNCLLIKIKTLEENIHEKTDELKESQDECTKLESVLQVYKTERKSYQCLKKDRDFLLTALWKILKRLEEEPKESKSKKITETLFKRFERELMDLKLEDFRYNKLKYTSRLIEKEESEFLFSPESQVLDSVESDFIDTDAPESVKSSFEHDEKIKQINSNQRVADIKHQNNSKTVEVNVVENHPHPLPNLSFKPFISRDFEERINPNSWEKYTSKDSVSVLSSEDDAQNVGQESSLTSVTSVTFPSKGSSTSDIITQQNIQVQRKCFENSLNLSAVKFFPQKSEDNLSQEGKMSVRFRKTYHSQKFKIANENEILKKKFIDNSQLPNVSSLPNGINSVLNAITNNKSSDIDVFNDSTEAIGFETDDVAIEDIGSIPHHIKYCDTIYNFLTSSGQKSHTIERTSNDNDSCLLFLTEKEFDSKPNEVHFDVEKTTVQKSPKTVSVFDVEDSGSLNPSGCVSDELGNICLEFNSDSWSLTDSRKVLNNVLQVNEKNNDINPDEISRKSENENKVDEQSQKISNPGLKESDINCNSNRIFDSMVTKNSPNLEFTQKENDISDEEVYRILKDFKNVVLLSPIKERKPSQRREVFASQSSKHDNCYVSEDVNVKSNLKSTDSREGMLHNKPDKNREALSCNPKTDEEREKKMLDKSMQTDDEVFLEARETERESNGTSGEMVFPKPVMKKLSKMVWKRNLKKFKHLKKLGNCVDFMKTIVEMINRPKLYFRNRKTENFYLMGKNTGYCESNLTSDEPRMSSWQVEDVEATNVISKDEPASNYPKVEDCSLFTPVPVHCYSKDKLNNSTVKSEETRNQKNKMSFNWSTSEQQMRLASSARRKLEVDGNTCNFDASRECEIDSDITLLRCPPNVTVNDSEKRCEKPANLGDTTENVGNTRESVLENVPVTDVIGCNWDADQTKTDNLEKVEVQETEFRSGEVSSKTEENAVFRSPRVINRNSLLMEEKSPMNSQSLKGSHNLMKVDSFGISLPSVNGTGMESQSHKTPSNESINDALQTGKVSQNSKSPRWKDKFEELFGEVESQLDCGSTDSDDDPKTSFTPPEIQKQVSVNSETNANEYTFDATTVGKKRRVFCANGKSGGTNNNKKMKLDVLCAHEDEDYGGKSTGNEVSVNDTFSFRDIATDGNTNILDSIMTAMTMQTELFKVQTPMKETEVSEANHQNIPISPQPAQPKDCIPFNLVHHKICNEYRMKGDNVPFLNVPYFWEADNNFGSENFQGKKIRNNSEGNHNEDTKIKLLVEKEIRNFVKSEITNVQEGEEKVKSVVSILRNASENVIANTIVSEIMENVDEELQEFERPAPPLTQTQHRIMIILTVFSTSGQQFHRIGSRILMIIRQKIFPESFFWPDDSLEMATRFYAALCKKMNDVRGIWRFCFRVLTLMRQRWCIPILVVLQVWPDIIHNANEVENNILVKTFVNIILHSPKSEDMRRRRQEQKLLAIKHLLINFYNFDMNSTIESFTQKLWESFVNNTQGSIDALVLISRCRNWTWTRKNVVTKLVETLESWMNGNSSDIIVSEVLDVLQQITSIFPDANASDASSAEDAISVLTRILANEIPNPILKEKIIRVLCSLSPYANVKNALAQFLGKLSPSDPLYADIKKLLSWKNRKCKQGVRRANTITKNGWMKEKKKPKKKGKKKKKNSSREDSVLDIK